MTRKILFLKDRKTFIRVNTQNIFFIKPKFQTEQGVFDFFVLRRGKLKAKTTWLFSKLSEQKWKFLVLILMNVFFKFQELFLSGHYSKILRDFFLCVLNWLFKKSSKNRTNRFKKTKYVQICLMFKHILCKKTLHVQIHSINETPRLIKTFYL